MMPQSPFTRLFDNNPYELLIPSADPAEERRSL
jgi:hypothetical protein